MEQDGLVTLDRVWQAERKWFKRTVIACFILFLALSIYKGVDYWVLSDITRKLISTDEEDTARTMELVNRHDLISAAVGVPLAISSIAFLTCMVCWILAIRARRCHPVEGAD